MQPQLSTATSTEKAWKAAKSSMFPDRTPQKRMLEEPIREATWDRTETRWEIRTLTLWTAEGSALVPDCTARVGVGSDGCWRSLQTVRIVPAAQRWAGHQKRREPPSGVNRSTSRQGNMTSMGTRAAGKSASRVALHTGWTGGAENSSASSRCLAGNQRWGRWSHSTAWTLTVEKSDTLTGANHWAKMVDERPQLSDRVSNICSFDSQKVHGFYQHTLK